MQTKHTPGPWYLYDKTIVWSTPSAGGGAVTMIGVADMRGININNELTPEAQANARLIAAAPALLEALNEVVNRPTRQESFILARAAIAKALGADQATGGAS